jgi:NADH-quinone oxidoreductase subunit H
MDLTYRLLLQLFPGASTWPAWVVVPIAVLLPTAIIIGAVAGAPVLYVYAERKVAGFTQDRLGPMRVGPYGILQSIADTIKLLFKEAVFPRNVHKLLFLTGPCLVVTGAFLALLVLPFGSRLQILDLNIGLLFVVAVSSLSTVGLILSGWASNNKYSLFGAMRAAAQIVSYEIPEVVILLSVVVLVGSLSLQDIVFAQAGGLQHWILFRYFPLMPVAFLVFFTAGLAEANRTPFDIPEAESELVGGFHTEYSGFFFAMFFLAEYTEMFTISVLASVLFLGGWHAPLPALQSLAGLGLPQIGLGPFWLVLKAWFLVFVMMWLRWTLPRLRVDQLMYVAWKVLLPVALALVLVVGLLVVLPGTRDGFPWDRFMGWPVTLALGAALLAGAAQAVRWRVLRQGELAR